MEITTDTIKKFIKRLDGLVDEIDQIGQVCTEESGHSPIGDALWSAQSDIESARETLKEAVE